MVPPHGMEWPGWVSPGVWSTDRLTVPFLAQKSYRGDSNVTTIGAYTL